MNTLYTLTSSDKQLQQRTDALFKPRSIALIGASTERHKWGNHIARHLLQGVKQRDIYLINPRGGSIEGVATYPSLSDAPTVPECAIIVIPAASTEKTVLEALDLGVRGFCIMTGGFGEISSEGQEAEQRIAEAIRNHGGILLGPNCVGFQESSECIYATRILYPEGPIGIVSQSGLITHDLSRYALSQRTGFSRVLNLGNQADLELSEAVASFIDHEHTRALVVYCEDLGDGRAFLDTAARVRDSGIPVILLTVGASAAAARSALSHTGALVTPIDATDAGCENAGILRTETTQQAISLADAFTKLDVPEHCQKVGIVTDGGGLGSLSSELISLAGLEVPQLSMSLQKDLNAASGPRAGTSNPIDMAGEADYDIDAYARVVARLLDSEEVDAVLLSAYFGGYSGSDDDVGRAETEAAQYMVKAAQARKKPFVVHTLYPDFTTGDVLRAGGIPVFRDLENAVEALRGLGRLKTNVNLPPLPRVQKSAAPPSGYWDVRKMMQARGIKFARAIIATDSQEAISFADRVGYPVVAKAVGLLHKSDQDGVKLGLSSPEEVAAAFDDLKQRFPESPITLEQQAPVSEGIELLIGARVDRHLGPLVTIALGGIYAEIFEQSATALAPVTQDAARTLILSLKAAPLLTGARGRPKLDIDSAAAIAVQISNIAAQMRDHIESIEANPVLVLADGAMALDARLIPINSVVLDKKKNHG